MQSLDQLFVYRLQELLSTEEAAAAALEKLTGCQSDPQLRRAFEAHLGETRTQIDRLRGILASMGLEPAPAGSEGMGGIVLEHDRFLEGSRPSPHVHAVYDVGAGQALEQYEIAAYHQVVQLAAELGYDEAARRLRTTLDEERRQLQRLLDVSRSIGLVHPGGREHPQPRERPEAGQRRRSGQRRRTVQR